MRLQGRRPGGGKCSISGGLCCFLAKGLFKNAVETFQEGHRWGRFLLGVT